MPRRVSSKMTIQRKMLGKRQRGSISILKIHYLLIQEDEKIFQSPYKSHGSESSSA
uniref:Uncharacterized protein n=1 Tax=Arundo donax TaxID=35708 RepID=A0A0A8Y2L2_ARUDO